MPTVSNLSQLTQDAVNEFKKATLNAAAQSGDTLGKAVTQSTGLVWYDLQAPAKNLFPVLTPIRNSIARVSGGGGTATNWKRVTAINSTALNGFVPEGTRNGTVTTTVSDKSASYKTLGLEDSLTFEAEVAAKNFEDERAMVAQRLLWATMIREEIADLGANLSVALGTPTAPTLAVVDGGGTITDGNYDVRVCALTMDGYLSSSVSGGVATTTTVTPADGSSSFSYNGGSSAVSSATATGAFTNGNDSAIKMSTPVVAGAVAYAWYVGAHSGTLYLQAITTINSHILTADPIDTTQASTAITADHSQNAYGYDGFLYHAWTTSSGAYIKNLATGTPGTGTGLTGDGAGGISELNDMFLSMWNNYKLSPTRIYANAQEVNNITNKVLSAGDSTKTVARVQYVQSGDVASGLRVKSVLNRFAMGGSVEVPIEIHPYLPAGTMLAVTEQLPYPMNNVPNVAEMRLRRDYYQIEWPLRTRKYETGVYFDGVLAHYFPPALGIITNIANA